jgi:small subunit ribosomal protein S17
MKEEKKVKKLFSGVVVSNKMQKTLVVNVDSRKRNDLLGVDVKSSKRFKVDCPDESEYPVGTVVQFTQCRPISGSKRHRVISS